MIHSWVPDLIFPPALPWVHRAEVPVAVNHQILFSHYSVKSKRGCWFQKDLKNRFYFILKMLYILATMKDLLNSTLALKKSMT